MTGHKLTCPHLAATLSICMPMLESISPALHESLNTLELRQERQQLSKLPCLSTCLYASISTVELSPLFALAQCGTQQFSLHVNIARYASEVSSPWPHQLLLPDCVHFSCCSTFASASAVAAPQLWPLQLLLPAVYNHWTGLLDWTTGLDY